jgi:NAD(P)H-dependent nitrite reductase small subunit
MAEWLRVASLGDLPTDIGTYVEVGRREMALFLVEGAVYAIDNECPHREGPLWDGDLDGEIVTCPIHAWQINVRTGEVPGVPNLCTRTYPVKVENGEVFIEI